MYFKGEEKPLNIRAKWVVSYNGDGDIPGISVVRPLVRSVIPPQGAQVWSLVGELRSCMLCRAARKMVKEVKNKKNTGKITDMGSQKQNKINVSSPQLGQSAVVTKNNNSQAETKTNQTNQRIYELWYLLQEHILLSLHRKDKNTY